MVIVKPGAQICRSADQPRRRVRNSLASVWREGSYSTLNEFAVFDLEHVHRRLVLQLRLANPFQHFFPDPHLKEILTAAGVVRMRTSWRDTAHAYRRHVQDVLLGGLTDLSGRRAGKVYVLQFLLPRKRAIIFCAQKVVWCSEHWGWSSPQRYFSLNLATNLERESETGPNANKINDLKCLSWGSLL